MEEQPQRGETLERRRREALPRNPATNWYVIQIHPGYDDRDALKIREAIPDENLLKEVFSPSYAMLRRRHGEERLVMGRLLPGYLIAVTSRPHDLAQALRRVPLFTQLIKQGGEFAPLRQRERELIEASTSPGNRVIPPSQGYRPSPNDHVVITAGPLVGREGIIKKVETQKQRALLEFWFFGRTMTVPVGFNLVKQAEEAPAEANEQ